MISFTAFGHPEIRGTHKTTLEFTKEAQLTSRGDCIIGVRADFNAIALQRLAQSAHVVSITISVNGVSDTINAVPNKLFADNHELVIRMGAHASPRTFACRADKSALFLKRELIAKLRNPDARVEVLIEEAIR